MTDSSRSGWSSQLAEQIRGALRCRPDGADATGQTWVRVTVPVDWLPDEPDAGAGVDPWVLAHDAGRVRMLWHRDLPDGGGETITALHAVHVLELEAGRSRFASAARQVEAFRQRTIFIGEPDEQLPMFVGGFAFADDRAPEVFHLSAIPASRYPHELPLWFGWDGGLLYLPEVLICRRNGRTTVTVHAPVNVAGDSCDAAADGAVRSVLGSLDWIREVEPSEPPRIDPLPRRDAEASRCTASGDRDEWMINVSAARQAIERGELTKVVVARKVELPSHPEIEPVDVAFTLRRTQPGCITFYLTGRDGVGGLVGSTPETLVSLRAGSLQTTALAGTRKRNGGEGSLLDSAKDSAEQQVVTEAILDALRPLCTELGPSSERRLATFADVQHIETPLHGTLRDAAAVGIFRLLDALHPTPAVGGAPREAALRWIADHEHVDRGWYAAPVGWVTPGADGCFAVAIRSALVRADAIHAFVGAGIVADSDPAAEWDETRWKLHTITGAVLAHLREPGNSARHRLPEYGRFE